MNKIGNSCFMEYIGNISANKSEIDKIISSHTNVKERLSKSYLNNQIVKMILVGSYARGTNTKTLTEDDKKIDVDVAVILKKDSYEKPQPIIDKIYNKLDSCDEYKGNVKRQKRSVGIELSKTHIDVVPFQEKVEDTDSPLLISKKDKQEWDITDPIGHINYFKNEKKDKNNFNEYVKALKWWKKINKPANIKFPISIAFEKWVTEYYVEEGNKLNDLINIMSNIYNNLNSKILKDPCIESNNLLEKMSDLHFIEFKKILKNTIDDLKDGLENENIEKIRERLGYDFPKCNIVNEQVESKLRSKTKEVKSYSSRIHK